MLEVCEEINSNQRPTKTYLEMMTPKWDPVIFNTVNPRQNGHHFADDIFNCIFLNENVSIPIKMPLKVIPKGPINTPPGSVKIMAWHRPDSKPLSEPMMVSLPTHISLNELKM